MSTAKFDTLSTLDGTKSITTDRVTQGTAAAWVNFNGTGTVAIRASYNVASITDNGTGDYTVNFTTAMPDANYAVSASNDGGFSQPFESATARTASLVRLRNANSANAAADATVVNVAIFR